MNKRLRGKKRANVFRKLVKKIKKTHKLLKNRFQAELYHQKYSVPVMLPPEGGWTLKEIEEQIIGNQEFMGIQTIFVTEKN